MRSKGGFEFWNGIQGTAVVKVTSAFSLAGGTSIMVNEGSGGLALYAGGDNGAPTRQTILLTRQPRLGRFALIAAKRLDFQSRD